MPFFLAFKLIFIHQCDVFHCIVKAFGPIGFNNTRNFIEIVTTLLLFYRIIFVLPFNLSALRLFLLLEIFCIVVIL